MHHPLSQGFDYFYGSIGTNLEDFGPGTKVILCLRPNWYGELFSTWMVTTFALWCLWTSRYISTSAFLVALIVWTLPFLSIYILLDNFELLASFLHRNHDLVEQPIRLAGLSQKLVHEGLEFMKNATEADKPFLIMMSWIHMHVAIQTAQEFEGKSEFGRYGDGLMELDWSVGQMLQGLRELDVEDNTVVYFTSDNGGHLEILPYGGYNGKLRGMVLTYVTLKVRRFDLKVFPLLFF